MWSLFSSKNKKIVKKFVKEHEKIVILAGNVITAYTNNRNAQAKAELKKLSEGAINHIMMEDIEFYRILRDSNRSKGDIEQLIKEFNETFYDIKLTLIDFFGSVKNFVST